METGAAGIDTLRAALNIETAMNNIAVLKVGSISISISFPDQSSFDYIRRVTYPFLSTRSSIDTFRSSNHIIEAIFDGELALYKSLVNFLSQKLVNEDEVQHLLSDSISIADFSKLGFINILDSNNIPNTVFNLSGDPQIGLSCMIRKVLLKEYFKMPTLPVIFHANAIVDLKKKETIVFACEDFKENIEKRGKTTITFANVLRSDSPYAFLANEDLVLNLDEQRDQIIWLPLPAEIPIGERHYNSLASRRIELQRERYEGEVCGERYYLVTTGNINNLGFKIAGEMYPITKWVFVNLDPKSQDYYVNRLTGDELEEAFINSVKIGRMSQLTSSVIWGEMANSHLINNFLQTHDDYILPVKRILNNMIGNVKFYTLAGGVDNEILFDLTQGLQ